MLEAVTTDLVSTISLKRSTQNLQLSTAAGRLPHLCAKRRHCSETCTRSESRITINKKSKLVLGTHLTEYHCDR
jgi:hypothetical protein